MRVVVIMVMRMIVDVVGWLVADEDIKLGGSDAVTDGLGGFVFRAQPQVFETVDQFMGVGTGVDQGTDGHVSAYAGESVKVGYSHRLWSLILLKQFCEDMAVLWN